MSQHTHEHATPGASHSWDDDQEWERSWWGDCTHTYAEETKHRTYARFMGLTEGTGWGTWPAYDIAGANVLDIGGGPVSMLLKALNRGPKCEVADPCRYPKWVEERYKIAGIGYEQLAGEDISRPTNPDESPYDEVWIYNVLQHTQDPELIINNAWGWAPVIRIFEWVDIPPHTGHPHELKKVLLDYWLGGSGTTAQLTSAEDPGCDGMAYGGRFERP